MDASEVRQNQQMIHPHPVSSMAVVTSNNLSEDTVIPDTLPPSKPPKPSALPSRLTSDSNRPSSTSNQARPIAVTARDESGASLGGAAGDRGSSSANRSIQFSVEPSDARAARSDGDRPSSQPRRQLSRLRRSFGGARATPRNADPGASPARRLSLDQSTSLSRLRRSLRLSANLSRGSNNSGSATGSRLLGTGESAAIRPAAMLASLTRQHDSGILGVDQFDNMSILEALAVKDIPQLTRAFGSDCKFDFKAINPETVTADEPLSGDTLLTYAVRTQHLDSVRAVLNASGLKPDDQAAREGSPLVIASNYGQESIVRFLLEAGSNPNWTPHDNKNVSAPLLVAAARGTLDALNALLECGAFVDMQKGWFGAALHQAALHDKPKACEILLQRGKASVDLERNEDGATALLLASSLGHLSCIKVLLTFGASVDFVYPHGSTALLVAVERGHFEVADELIAYGANIGEAAKNHPYLRLLLSSALGKPQDVAIAIRRRIHLFVPYDQTTQDLNDGSPLSPFVAAYKRNHVDIVNQFLNAKGMKLERELRISLWFEEEKLVKLLLIELASSAAGPKKRKWWWFMKSRPKTSLGLLEKRLGAISSSDMRAALEIQFGKCCICLEGPCPGEKETDEFTLPRCGHLTCSACRDQLMHHGNKCPECPEPLRDAWTLKF